MNKQIELTPRAEKALAKLVNIDGLLAVVFEPPPFGPSKRTVWAWVRQGRVLVVRVGRSVYSDPDQCAPRSKSAREVRNEQKNPHPTAWPAAGLAAFERPPEKDPGGHYREVPTPRARGYAAAWPSRHFL